MLCERAHTCVRTYERTLRQRFVQTNRELNVPPPSPSEEDGRSEDAGQEGAVEGEEAHQAAARGRGAGPGAGGGGGGAGGAGDGGPAGGGGGGGEPGAGRHGPPGEGLPGPRPAGAGQDEREAAEEDLLQEEQDGQWSTGPFLNSSTTVVSLTYLRILRQCFGYDG